MAVSDSKAATFRRLREIKSGRAGGSPVAPVDESVPGRPGPCEYEGPPVDYCKSLTGPAAEGRHVRMCFHPTADRDKCTRVTCGRAAGCDRCPDYTARGLSAVVTGGIGDFLAVEAALPLEDRDRLETVYYAAPATAEIEAVFRALPGYPRLARHVRLPTGGRTFYSAAEVAKSAGPLPDGVVDLSMGVVSNRRPVYRGSSALTRRLADPPPTPGPYAVVVPGSTWYAPAGRGFDDADWSACLAALLRYDLHGVVLCRDRLPVPDHPRLLDWQGRTSILESVELVKGASAYLGIDSWASVLAAKTLPGSRLSVKCLPRSHGYANRAFYYAPRTEFSFLSGRLAVPPWN